MSSSSRRNKGFLKRNFRHRVLARDNYECKILGCKSKNIIRQELQVHHIVPIKDAPLLAYNTRNGITVCRECHTIIHNKEKQYKLEQAMISTFHSKFE